MKKFANFLEQEIILGSSNPQISSIIKKALKAGQLKKIAPRIYTSNLKDSPQNIIHRHLYFILGKLFPEAVISHRSALEGGVSREGIIVLSYKYTKNFKLPGVVVKLVKGSKALESDTQFLENLYFASRSRAFLENLAPSRSRVTSNKCLSLSQIEERLDKAARVYGMDELNRLRDEARVIAKKLGLTSAYKKLNQLVAAISGTHKVGVLKSDVTKARGEGKPYDPNRLNLFTALAFKLQSEMVAKFTDRSNSQKAKQNFSFFEAYFSNFIEGTEFEISEAEEIVFQNKVNPQRPEDSHDILGTYYVVSNTAERSRVPESSEDFIVLLKKRHAILMEGRLDKNPGEFKTILNRAGNTVFVKPDEVRGTLEKGFENYQKLKPGFERAVYMMFLVSEVHPFLDGNGRIARVMMNAELSAVNECRILIPTVYREDYLSTIRRLSRQYDPEPYVRMLFRAQDFSSRFDFENYENALSRLRTSNAFELSSEAKLIFPD